ncbi:MAG: LysR family transcriptional regulator [Pseudomonadota bacterium]|uniref:LysR family transcriptional regulator n=1 Tax=unclassified Phenylobacterium TaxID=2640670 RepID=UPI0006FDACA4|nr:MULTISPECIES: LysR family transcriptional regulator [unclassified Phenylobacterium]KRB46596.1 LysR family transcriptional regulator [Phenylobacterium sp. Root700]MBT9470481.1 LysR family transcriptional regulator [Phenylobacterium sp.]
MQFRRSDFADLSYFLEIAKHRNFRRAGLELGLSASALSHALRGLEERLGVRLLNRTSRSVTLTAAGEALQAAVQDPFLKIAQALDVVNRFRDAPMGRVRLSVPNDAADHLLAPVLPTFIERYPDVELEVSVSNRLIDVIEKGFDAGIRYDGTVPEDMVAQRLSADIRWIVVGAPAYLERFGVPAHPNDLQSHRCIRIRIGDDSLYRWEFERGDEQLAIAVPGSLVVDDGRLGLAAARDGVGLMYVADTMVRRELASGELRIVLGDWATSSGGYHIYYSSRRQVPAALRLFIDLVRELRPLGL